VLKIYAVSLMAMFEDARTGGVMVHHAVAWLSLDEREDAEAVAEDLAFERFPEEDGWYKQGYCVVEVPGKAIRRCSEMNRYEEEPVARTRTRRLREPVVESEPLPRSRSGRSREQEPLPRRRLHHLLERRG
jgi:hypothetical protein